LSMEWRVCWSEERRVCWPVWLQPRALGLPEIPWGEIPWGGDCSNCGGVKFGPTFWEIVESMDAYEVTYPWRRIWGLTRVFWAGLALVAGCQSLARPQWIDPAPLSRQQARAHQFDPFPENEPGPAVVGGRPREFDRAVPEPRRARLIPWWATRR